MKTSTRVAVMVATASCMGGARAAQAQTITSGYVLTHEHPTYGMSFGGNYAFAGAPGNYVDGIMEQGYTGPCGGCNALSTCDHGEVKGNFIGASGQLGRDIGNHASHMGPLHDSNSHLRYSTEWIYEAFSPSEPMFSDDRMKIMVAFAMENEAMCQQLYEENRGGGGPGGAGYGCTSGDSWTSLIRQLDAIKSWAGRNSRWMEIAYSASDARRIVLSGKLAIVLGIESEYAFGAEDRAFDPVERLRDYYDEGVRTFYLAHKINSRLAGADLYYPQGTMPGKTMRATQAISGCYYYDDNVGDFPLHGRLGNSLCDNGRQCGDNALRGGGPFDQCTYAMGDISEINMADYVLRGAGAFNGFSIYPMPPGFGPSAVSFTPANAAGTTGGDPSDDHDIEHNNLGLSHDGERVVREAMRLGMIVNLDHVSSKSRLHIRSLSDTFDDYPLNALHNKPNSMLDGAYPPHEYDLSDAEIDMITDTGGFFGLRMGPTDAKEGRESSGIRDNCPDTSTETGKMLAWLLERGVKVGYSLDYAAITKGLYSRTFAGCGAIQTDDFLHTYGTHLTEGLSHVGMIKKWHRELEAVGMDRRYVDELRHAGAEAFVAMWERSERKSRFATQIPRRIFASVPPGDPCSEDSECATGEYCSQMGWDPRPNECTDLKEHGALCTDRRQCATGRCAWGFCAYTDECRSHGDCSSGEYCGDPIAGRRQCKALKPHGAGCTSASQCATGRCSWGFCADPDECRSHGDCSSSEYCGDPISGKRSCKALKSHGSACTSASQCATGRCAWGFCADADECRADSDCSSSQFCGDPISGKRKCKTLRGHGAACTRSAQCSTGRCAWGMCADADECRSNSDCDRNHYCGDPVSGRRRCKDFKENGQSCTKSIQCRSGKCRLFRCRA